MNQISLIFIPIGTDEHGQTGVKCVLIHKSGHVIESDTYPFRTAEGSKLQDEGTEITYRKRYALSSFLGMATEEDNDGNDMQSINSTDRKATPKQIDILLQYYSGDSLDKLLKSNNIKKIEDLSLKRASDLIKIKNPQVQKEVFLLDHKKSKFKSTKRIKINLC